jgi:CRP-like cAMP-binding protein
MIPLAWSVGIASVALSYITALTVSRPIKFIESLGLSISAASEVVLRYLIPYLITTLFLVVVYRFMPTTKIRWPVIVAGSAIAAFFLEIIKQLFTWYIANFTRYDVIFGSLTAVVILVVGVYYNAMIFLFCSELMSSYLRRDILLLEKAILKPDKHVIKVKERLFKKFGRVYEKDSIIFKEGDGGHDIFYVISGRVFLEKVDCHIKKVLAEMGPGQYFGEMAALIDIPRSATARASEKSNLAVIDGDTLCKMLEERRSGALYMLREFSRRLIHTNVALEKTTNLGIYLTIIIYFMNNPDAKIEEHLPHIVKITEKEPAQIRAIIKELTRQNILTVKNDVVSELSRNRMWKLLDSGELSKCFDEIK